MARTDLLQTAMYYHSLGYQVIPLCTPNLHGQGCLQHGSKGVHPGRVPLIKWKDLMLGKGEAGQGNQRGVMKAPAIGLMRFLSTMTSLGH